MHFNFLISLLIFYNTNIKCSLPEVPISTNGKNPFANQLDMRDSPSVDVVKKKKEKADKKKKKKEGEEEEEEEEEEE